MVRYNAEWLSKLTFADLIHLASNFTIQQFLTREAFRKRWDARRRAVPARDVLRPDAGL